MIRIVIASILAWAAGTASVAAIPAHTVKAIISGGFSRPYNEVLPDFEKSSGLTVETASGASDGTGPQTIRYQLAHGAKADLVILSREGLQKLAGDGRIRRGTEVALATAPLAAAVRTGSPKPDIASAAAFRIALVAAGRVVMPGSTSGLFVRDHVFPKLHLPGSVTLTLAARGSEAVALLKAGKADLLMGPVSELIHQPGVEIVGVVPDAFQIVQTFTIATVADAANPEGAARLTRFLASDRVTAAIKRAGMARPTRP